jgi:phosphatidylethanolamine-binding protein (PEBP) family uncharacterized protein
MSPSFVSRLVISTLSLSLLVATGCSSDNNGGGSPGTGGTTSGSGGNRNGGSTGSGGSSTSGSGGSSTSGTGGSSTSSGGSTGSGGSSTSSGGSTGSGGTTGSGGAGGSSSGDAGGMDRAPEVAAEVGAPDTAMGAFMFTSSGLRMMGNGLVFPAAHSAPMNQSPPFTWSGAPAGTMSFAITLHDISANGTHWVIHDIPANVTMLPQGLPRGLTLTTPVMAKQKAIYGMNRDGYEGPGGNSVNNYEFELWPLNVATLPANVAAMTPPQMRSNANGLRMYVAGPTVKIMARGTRGGL